VAATRILIADDDETLREELADMLRSSGHDVHVAGDGMAALRILESRPIDIAFVDWAMPEATGIEVLRRAKALRPKAAIVLMTGFGTVGTAVNALKSGATDFVEKPFEPQAVERIVDSVREKLAEAPPAARDPTAARASSPTLDVRAAMLHHRTGLLISAKTLAGERTADHDLLVATLDVIRNFMEISFPILERKQLHTIVQGDYTLILEEGRHTFLTVVIRGVETEPFRTHVRAILENFETANGSILASWNGEPDELEAADLLLNSLLAERSWSSG
jgi:DNA-binding response OmpR family regulator